MALPNFDAATALGETSLSELTDQQAIDLQAHHLDCDKLVSDCFPCWQLEKQAEIDAERLRQRQTTRSGTIASLSATGGRQ